MTVPGFNQPYRYLVVRPPGSFQTRMSGEGHA